MTRLLVSADVGAPSEERDSGWRRGACGEAFENEGGDDAPACQLWSIHRVFTALERRLMGFIARLIMESSIMIYGDGDIRDPDTPRGSNPVT